MKHSAKSGIKYKEIYMLWVWFEMTSVFRPSLSTDIRKKCVFLLFLPAASYTKMIYQGFKETILLTWFNFNPSMDK